jgi:hypothetical protein
VLSLKAVCKSRFERVLEVKVNKERLRLIKTRLLNQIHRTFLFYMEVVVQQSQKLRVLFRTDEVPTASADSADGGILAISAGVPVLL